ncbi:MAG: hypothetical protein R6X02_21645 [Enhygromyxa sp.]
MSEANPVEPASLRPLPRWSLTLVAGLHALIFAWAGAKLPWSDWSSFAIVCYALALGHLATAVAAAGELKVLARIWQVTSVFSLLVFGWLSWELVGSAAYLAELYGDLGQGIGAGMLAIIGLLALLSVPLAAWGLAATWRRSYGPRAAAVTALVVIAVGSGAWREAAAARARPLPVLVDEQGRPAPLLFEDELERARGELISSWDSLPEIPREGKRRKGQRRQLLRVPSLLTTEPIACVPDPDGELAIAVVTFLARQAEPDGRSKMAPVEALSRCVEAPPERLAEAIIELIRSEAQRGPVKIDVIVGAAPLRSRSPALDMLALRPGLDGVCDDEHCLMPWQLIAADMFVANKPLPWVPDLRFGVSPVALRKALGFDVPPEVERWDREQRDSVRLARLIEKGSATPKPDDADGWLLLDGLVRIETLSSVFDTGGLLVPLVRGHERDLELSRARLEHALELAELHITGASQSDGRFRYTLDPFTGKQRNSGWNLPRQAGTTLVLCELGRDEQRTREVAAASLDFMASRARPSGDRIALTRGRSSPKAGLGSTALPAIAFFSCRDRVGPEHDPTRVGMANFLLAMQREDGSFYPEYDLEAGQPIDGPEPMYAGGQAIFALLLAEKLALSEPEVAAAAGLPEAAILRDAVERAIGYYTGPYWDTFARDFFWLEENWHCLAARAALEHHRNEAYEQFCVDYMTYKSRVVLDEHSEVAAEFQGGYSLGNILVPVNTPAAGFGEGLAAAMAIKHARGEDLSADRELMRRAIEFLVRQQWNERTCFACAPHRTVIGGFSESMSAPEIRIDYTQHAWAALGHGGAWIADELPDRGPNDD